MPDTSALDTTANVFTTPAQAVVDVSTNPYAWVVVCAVAVVTLAVVLVLRVLWKKLTALRSSLDMRVLLVLVPRLTGQPEEKQEVPTQQKIQEQIGVAEVLWSAIGGLKAQHGFMRWLKGRSDHLALEIVAQNGTISFYLAVPQKLKTYLEQQVQAHYPYAVLEEVADYNMFTPRGATLAAQVYLTRQSAFPIKTYKQFESDPLNALTNVLSKVGPGDGVAIQLVVRSAKRSWRRRGVKLALAMQQGKSMAEAEGSGWFNKGLRAGGDFLPGSSSKDKKDKHGNYKEPRRLSPLEEEMVKGIEQKASKAGLDVTLRVVSSAGIPAQAKLNLDNVVSTFSQFNVYQYGNSFRYVRPSKLGKFMFAFIHRTFVERKRFVLNTEELASLYHFPLATTETPNIHWLTARKAPPPQNVPSEGVILGVNSYRGQDTLVRIARKDRARHFYVIGKSGTGKSVLQENMAVQDIENGEGVCVIDPHGDLVDAILARVPASRAQDLILFDPADVERPQGLNLLEYDARYPEQKTFVINEMIKIFDKLYDLKQTGGPMFEQYVRNAMLLIMDDPESGSTLMEISKVLADPDYRKYKLTKIKNPVVYDFWVKEAQKAGGDASLANMVPYITSKLNQFVANDIMRPIIGQQNSAFNLRDVMDSRKILLVRLSKGKLGDMNTYLLGLVMVGKILMAALSRTDVPDKDRPDFYLYIDEFQNFITDSIAVILSEARKYHLNLIIAHQYIGQLTQGQDTKIRDAVFGNVGTIASFRVGVEDAEFLAKEFAPVFTSYDVINIELYHAYVKLLINNTPARPFQLMTLPPPQGNTELARKLKELSRLRYGRPRAEVEAEILERAKKASTPLSAPTPLPPLA